MAGPSVDSQPKDINGFPETLIYATLDGHINQTYQVASPISKQLSGNAYIANYFCPGGQAFCPGQSGFTGATLGSSIVANGYADQNAVTAMMPQPSFPHTGTATAGSPTITGIGGLDAQVTASRTAGLRIYVYGPGVPLNSYITGAAGGNITLNQNATASVAGGVYNLYIDAGYETLSSPYYEWQCLDSAKDYVARIRVLVRSWTSVAAAAAAVQTNGTAGNPFACGTETSFPYERLYDYSVWPQCTSATFGVQGFGETYPGLGI